MRWYKGDLELGILPHLMLENDLRVLVDLRDLVTYRTISEINASKTVHDVENRNRNEKGTKLTEQAVRDDIAKPILKISWLSPNYQVIKVRT